MQLKLTKIFQKVPEGYIGFVEELPGANTQGETLEETRSNLEEAIELLGKRTDPDVTMKPLENEAKALKVGDALIVNEWLAESPRVALP